jgi:hypothetical protein
MGSAILKGSSAYMSANWTQQTLYPSHFNWLPLAVSTVQRSEKLKVLERNCALPCRVDSGKFNDTAMPYHSYIS